MHASVMPNFSERDLLTPLADSFATAGIDAADFVPAVLKNATSQDTLYALPYDLHALLVHANMDLYRFAYKIAPFCPSEVVADAFDVARAAREVDMRASPYDLTAYGFAPVKIETRTGREEYIELQRDLAARAAPVRERVLDVYRRLLAAGIGG